MIVFQSTHTKLIFSCFQQCMTTPSKHITFFSEMYILVHIAQHLLCVWFNSVFCVCPPGIQWSFINNNLQSQNSSRSAKGSSSLDRLYSRKIRKQLVHHKQVNVSHSNTNTPLNPHSQMCVFNGQIKKCDNVHRILLDLKRAPFYYVFSSLFDSFAPFMKLERMLLQCVCLSCPFYCSS